MRATTNILMLPEAFVPRSTGVLRRLGRVARKHPEGMLGLVVLLGFVFLGIFGPAITPYPPRQIAQGPVLGTPSWDHPFGLNSLGQDIFSRVIAGARISLLIGGVSVFIGSGIGSFLGIASGYYGRWVDYVIQRSSEAFSAFPAIILFFLLRTALGQGPKTVIITIAITGVFSGSRILRAQTIIERNMAYVEAARSIGCAETRIFLRHVFPNVLPLTIVLLSTSLGGAILAESALAFLGLGLEPGTPSWGLDMSGENLSVARLGYWHLIIFPGIAISLVVLAANLFGDALRDILDPRLRR